MDSGHYQSLSHALNPTLAAPQSRSPYSSSSVFTPPPRPASIPSLHHQSMNDGLQDEDDQEDDDEGIVEGQLEMNDHSRQETGRSTPPQANLASNGHPTLHIVHDTGNAAEKRKPGRPRGSRNKKPRAPPGSKAAAAEAAAQGNPPPHTDLNPAHQQYYDFQWKVLNLCTEFYGAAEELVKSTNPLVIAQCYHMGPGAKLDPLVMITEAKRVCDALLANPSQLLANPLHPCTPLSPHLLLVRQPSSPNQLQWHPLPPQ
ncbi:hypothetical protein NMY22_g19409 [Coprinellus aureogranulatus]|nr:hypothetical protein NMY22_g19409 [Coprinellus aureogranulatus]